MRARGPAGTRRKPGFRWRKQERSGGGAEKDGANMQTSHAGANKAAMASSGRRDTIPGMRACDEVHLEQERLREHERCGAEVRRAIGAEGGSTRKLYIYPSWFLLVVVVVVVVYGSP